MSGIDTINVIEVLDGEIVPFFAFPNTKEGKADARQVFGDIVTEILGVPEGEIQELFDAGYASDDCGYEIHVRCSKMAETLIA